MIEVGPVLYVQTPGATLSLDGDAIKATLPDGTWRRLPIARIDAVVAIGNVQISTQLLCRCAEEDRAVTFLSRTGRPRATLAAGPGGNHVARHAQHLAHADLAARLAIAQRIVSGKLQNQQLVLERLRRDAPTSKRDHLKRTGTALSVLRERARNCPTRTRLMGIEGAAARAYFRATALTVSPSSDIPAPPRRVRRPCTDPFNATLSFTYGLLASQVRGAVITAGLDPGVGFLHGDRAEQPSLVLDLMEEFRPAADRLTLTLVNRRQLQKKHFTTAISGATELDQDGRDIVLRAWHELRSQTFPSLMLAGAPAPFGAQTLLQARALARHLTGDAPVYTPWTFES